MLRAFLTTAKSLMLGESNGSSGLADIDEVELQRRIRDLDAEKQEVRQELDALRDRYQSTIDRAKVADGAVLNDVRSELASVVRQAAVARARFSKALVRIRNLHMVVVVLRSDRSLPDFDFDVSELPALGPEPDFTRPEAPLGTERDTPESTAVSEETRAGMQAPLGDFAGRIDDAVAAARNGNPVPTLDELLETETDDDLDEIDFGDLVTEQDCDDEEDCVAAEGEDDGEDGSE